MSDEQEKIVGAQSATAVETAEPVASESAIARHTPGPWMSFDSGTLIICESPRDLLIASLDDTEVETSAELQANAHLIAAAPEMKDALEGVTPLCNAIYELIADDEDLRARVMALFIKHGLEDDYGFKVAQALAKAEGR